MYACHSFGVVSTCQRLESFHKGRLWIERFRLRCVTLAVTYHLSYFSVALNSAWVMIMLGGLDESIVYAYVAMCIVFPEIKGHR